MFPKNMRNLILSFLLILFFTACENEQETVLPEGQSKAITARTPNKVNVCHNGNIINISINALPDHQGHGDAVDLDGDGYFDLANDCVSGVDCDDTDADINAEGTDVPCNGIDEDCSGTDDASTADTWYEDSDGDSYGNAGSALAACTQPEGYVADNTDCDDDNGGSYPGNAEVCGNGIDDNCDGNVDEGCCDGGTDGLQVISNSGLYWMSTNLNLDVAGSLCYDNNPANCTSNGRLYSEAAAQTACAQLGDCWRLPTLAEWGALVNTYGGYFDPGAYSALIQGGSSGFNALNTGGLYVPAFDDFFSFDLYGQYLTTSPGQRVCFNANGSVTQCSTGPDFYASCRCVKEAQ